MDYICRILPGGGVFRGYWDDKIRKIFQPYWYVTIFYFVFFCQNLSKTVLLKNLLCVDYERQIDATMWYMSFLVLWYLLFFILYYFKIDELVKIILILLTALVIRENSGLFGGCAWQFRQNIFSFPLGVCFGYVISKIKLKRIIVPQFLLSVEAISIVIYLCAILKGYSYQWTGILLIFICLLSIYNLRNFKWDIHKWLLLGNCSYPLYLLEGKLFEIIPEHTSAFINVVSYIGVICLCVLAITLYSQNRIKINTNG